MEAFVEQCREWQRKNPEWELICDIENSNAFYTPQWGELSLSEKYKWNNDEDFFNEFTVKTCKVDTMVLGEDFKLYPVNNWPHGKAMQIFYSKNLPPSSPAQVRGVGKDKNYEKRKQ